MKSIARIFLALAVLAATTAAHAPTEEEPRFAAWDFDVGETEWSTSGNTRIPPASFTSPGWEHEGFDPDTGRLGAHRVAYGLHPDSEGRNGLGGAGTSRLTSPLLHATGAASELITVTFDLRLDLLHDEGFNVYVNDWHVAEFDSSLRKWGRQTVTFQRNAAPSGTVPDDFRLQFRLEQGFTPIVSLKGMSEARVDNVRIDGARRAVAADWS